jgi:hypothetical protein
MRNSGQLILEIVWIIIGVFCIIIGIRSAIIGEGNRFIIFLLMAALAFLFAWFRHNKE